MPRSLISVIMSVRNGEVFLAEALDSIAAQNDGDIEVIIVDDGSSDGTAVIASEHKLRARVVSQDALGQAAGLNRGIALASGKLLAFIDHDDVWPKERLSAMRQAINLDPLTDAVHGLVVNTDASLKPFSEPIAAQVMGAMLIDRSAALKIGQFRTDVQHASIVDWISRARRLGVRFKYVDQLVLYRRIHGDNMGIRERPLASENLLRVIRDHVNRHR